LNCRKVHGILRKTEERREAVKKRTVRGYIDPSQYMFSKKYGSLFQDESVANVFPWLEEAGRNLPNVFGTEDLYEYLKSLPEPELHIFDSLDLKCLHRIAKRYAFLASAYLKNHSHGKPLKPDLCTIPRNLARPFVYVSKLLEMPPVLSYKHYCQGNWRLKNPFGPFIVENLRLEQCFVDPRKVSDESGFILVHTVIEERGKHIPFAITRCFEAMRAKNHLFVTAELLLIDESLKDMEKELLLMPKYCDPKVYYLEVRPQIQLFQGVRYEGAEDIEFIKPFPIDFRKPVTLRGETGAQSPLLHLLFVFLKIPEKKSPLREYRRDMRNYMMREQRIFIEFIEQAPSIRLYIQRYGRECPELRKAYNSCVDSLAKFLEKHYEYAIEYIEKRGEDSIGTGGTPFKKFLARHLEEIRVGKL